VQTVWDDISYVFYLDPESVSNVNVLQHNTFFSENPHINNDSGFMCILKSFSKYKAVNFSPSVKDLRQAVINRIEENKDPVIRTIHLNEHCTRMNNQAGLKSCTSTKSSDSERY
jgi:hypothetical protein